MQYRNDDESVFNVSNSWQQKLLLTFFVSSNSECEDDDDASIDGADAAADGADAAVIECVSLPVHSLEEVVM